MKSADQATFHTLDGIRGIGALLVCYGHAGLLFTNGSIWQFINPICVDIFFVLSGFVIAYAYEPRFQAGMKASEFMRQRVIRLYPIFLLGIAMGFLLRAAALLDDASPRWDALSAGTITQAFMLPAPWMTEKGLLYPLNFPAWTLLFELSINLVYVLVFPWLTTRRLVAITAFSALAYALAAYSFETNNPGVGWETLLGGIPRASVGFFLGVLIFRVSGSPKNPVRKRSIGSAFAVLILLALCFIPSIPGAPGIAEVAAILLIVPPAIYWAQRTEPPKWLAPAFGWLGGVSYALYMVHAPLLEFILRVDWRLDGALSAAPLASVLFLLLALGVAWIADVLYDRPARRWLARATKRKTGPTAMRRSTASASERAA